MRKSISSFEQFHHLSNADEEQSELRTKVRESFAKLFVDDANLGHNFDEFFRLAMASKDLSKTDG